MDPMPSKNPKKTKPFILVAEDDKFYAHVYALKLKSEGFETKVVGDGAQAIAAAKKQKPALMVLDLMMPVQDGFETLRQLKADPALAKIKTIVCSNLGQEDDLKRAKELGADDYWVKANISVQEMIDKIKATL